MPEFGFGIMQLYNLLEKLREFAVHMKTAGGEIREEEFSGILTHCGFTPEQTNALLNRLTLPKRLAWNTELPPRCSEHDVYPWRYRRQLSLLVRPLVELTKSPRSWFLSIPMLEQATSYLVGNVERAYFPEAFFASPEMRRYVGEMANKRGHDFACRVETVFSTVGLKTSLELEMTALGAAKNDGLGDIDVLAWNPAKGHVYAVECKCLRTASSIREVVQRLEDFRGNRKEKDSLARHLRRMDWITAHVEAIAKYTGIVEARIKLMPLLVTNETVPMQFFKEMKFPTAQVIPFQKLSKLFQSRG